MYTTNAGALGRSDRVDLLSGSPLYLPLDGFDPNGGQITYTATSDNSNVTTYIPQGNRSLKIDVDGYGTMLFQLFDDRASRATNRIAQLAQSGFYDDIIFHRVIANFMIQGGDPTGTGSGGSTLGDFDDQFHVDLQHNRTGLLSMAKSGDDTNDSQFFITDQATRHLDFNHTVFGMLLQGDYVRDVINSVPVGTGDKPTTNVVMEDVTVINDLENNTLMVKAAAGFTGTANITVTARDAQGNTQTRTFAVNATPDTLENGGPFLNDFNTNVTTAHATAVTGQLTSQDVEGDAVNYDAAPAGTGWTFSVAPNLGSWTFTPTSGFAGVFSQLVGVQADPEAEFDIEEILFTVTPPAQATTGQLYSVNVQTPEEVTRRTGTISGIASTAGVSYSITTAASHGFQPGQRVSLSGILGTGALPGDLNATVQVATVTSATVFTVLDSSAGGSYTSGGTFETPAAFQYVLSGAPAGMTINADTGALAWTPSAGQAGTFNFEVRATNEANDPNVPQRTMPFSVTVPGAVSTPSGVDLVAGFDSGTSSTDNLTNVTQPQFVVSGVTAGSTVRLYNGNNVIGQATAGSGGTVTVTPSSALPTGAHSISASQQNGGPESSKSTAVPVTIDTTAPASFTTIPTNTAGVGMGYVFDSATADEGLTGNTYSLQNAPTGMSIAPTTGVIIWTPTAAQVGPNSFTVRFSDAAGNAQTQNASIAVSTQTRQAMPDFELTDVNPNSPTANQGVSPRDHLGHVSAWYLIHST